MDLNQKQLVPTGLKGYNSLKISSKELLEYLKLLKFGKYVQIGFLENSLKFSNLDRKTYTGIISLKKSEISWRLFEGPLYFSTELAPFVKILERFNDKELWIKLVPSLDTIEITAEQENKTYNIPGAYGPKAKEVVDLNPTFEEYPQVTIKVHTAGLQELLKDVQAVDTKVNVRVNFEGESRTLTLESYSDQSMFTQIVSTGDKYVQGIEGSVSIEELATEAGGTSVEKVVIIPLALNNLLKSTSQTVLMQIYQGFLKITCYNKDKTAVIVVHLPLNVSNR